MRFFVFPLNTIFSIEKKWFLTNINQFYPTFLVVVLLLHLHRYEKSYAALEEWNSSYSGDKKRFEDAFSLEYLFHCFVFLRHVISDFYQYINKAEIREDEKLFITNSLKITLNGYYKTSLQLREGEIEIRSVTNILPQTLQQNLMIITMMMT